MYFSTEVHAEYGSDLMQPSFFKKDLVTSTYITGLGFYFVLFIFFGVGFFCFLAFMCY